jgi:retron-type reverse transcriptase
MATWLLRLDRNNRSNFNCNNRNLNNDNGSVFRIVLATRRAIMKKENEFDYNYLCSMGNLTLAWRNARKGKSKRKDVIKFEKDLIKNLLDLHYELKNTTYKPKPLVTFVLRDPKTRVISKSYFRDRIVHHAIILAIAYKFEKGFIYESCANQKGKGALFAVQRFRVFSRKFTNNFTSPAFCLKADIKHYFQEVNHKILMDIIHRKIEDNDILNLISKVNANFGTQRERERDKNWILA